MTGRPADEATCPAEGDMQVQGVDKSPDVASGLARDRDDPVERPMSGLTGGQQRAELLLNLVSRWNRTQRLLNCCCAHCCPPLDMTKAPADAGAEQMNVVVLRGARARLHASLARRRCAW